jgi:hypothetical protein
MHPLRRKKVVLASVLKPLDDTRMYEKMALSLVQDGRFAVTVVGFGEMPNAASNVQLVGLGRFGRLSFQRAWAPLRVLLKCIQVKPDILIVNTHELLLVGAANRILFGCQIWYDLQENYYRNIRFGGAFPSVVRLPLALWVRAKEKLLAPLYTGFFPAEKGYLHEMDFFGGRAHVLENKVARSSLQPRKKRPVFTFLFSGTLAPSTGIFEAVQFVKTLRAHGAPVRLDVIGYAALPEVREQLQAAVSEAPFIILTGVDQLVPHSAIMGAIAQADAGIIAYPPSPHTVHSIPTKLYEYLGSQLPIVCVHHPVWSELVRTWQAGISIDFKQFDATTLWQQLQSDFYPTQPEKVFWEEEALKFIEALEANQQSQA